MVGPGFDLGSPPRLHNPDGRFILRPWHQNDADSLEEAWLGDYSRSPRPAGLTAGEWIAGAPKRWSSNQAFDLVIEAASVVSVGSAVSADSCALLPGGRGLAVPALSADFAVLGEVGIRPITYIDGLDKERVLLDMSWWLDPGHRGQGLARGAVALVLAWLNTHNVGPVTAHIHPSNTTSIRLAECVGFILAGPIWIHSPPPV